MRGLNRVGVVLLGLMMISILCVLVKIEYQPQSVRALIISSAVGVVVLWPGELLGQSRGPGSSVACGHWPGSDVRAPLCPVCYVTCDV